MRTAPEITLSDEQREILLQWKRSHTAPARAVLRAKIVLLAAQGLQNKEIAAKLGVDRTIVARWRSRFAAHGLDGIAKEAAGRGRKSVLGDRLDTRIIEKTTRERPGDASCWSTRSLAKELGVSHSTVHRVWRKHGLTPHLRTPLLMGIDPRLGEKLVDVVGLFISPPKHALALSGRSGSEVTDPGAGPHDASPGSRRPEGVSRSFARHVSASLFAALHMAEESLPEGSRSTDVEPKWFRFLELVETGTPAPFDVHLITDARPRIDSAAMGQWRANHPRFNLHVVPDGSPWLAVVEGFLRQTITAALQRGGFGGIRVLLKQLWGDLGTQDGRPESFVWAVAPQ